MPPNKINQNTKTPSTPLVNIMALHPVLPDIFDFLDLPTLLTVIPRVCRFWDSLSRTVPTRMAIVKLTRNLITLSPPPKEKPRTDVYLTDKELEYVGNLQYIFFRFQTLEKILEEQESGIVLDGMKRLLSVSTVAPRHHKTFEHGKAASCQTQAVSLPVVNNPNQHIVLMYRDKMLWNNRLKSYSYYAVVVAIFPTIPDQAHILINFDMNNKKCYAPAIAIKLLGCSVWTTVIQPG